MKVMIAVFDDAGHIVSPQIQLLFATGVVWQSSGFAYVQTVFRDSPLTVGNHWSCN